MKYYNSTISIELGMSMDNLTRQDWDETHFIVLRSLPEDSMSTVDTERDSISDLIYTRSIQYGLDFSNNTIKFLRSIHTEVWITKLLILYIAWSFKFKLNPISNQVWLTDTLDILRGTFGYNDLLQLYVKQLYNPDENHPEKFDASIDTWRSIENLHLNIKQNNKNN